MTVGSAPRAANPRPVPTVQSTASQQLDILRRGAIVASRREGKTVLYRADREGAAEALADLQAYLKGCC